MRKFLIFALCLSCFSLENASASVISAKAKSLKNDAGIFYALPKTDLEITVTMRHVWEKRGPYYKYAEKCLGETGIIVEDKEYFAIEKIEVKEKTSPDGDHIYCIKEGKNSVANFLKFDENWRLFLMNGAGKPAEKSHEKLPKKMAVYQDRTPNLKFDFRELNEDVFLANSVSRMATLAAKQIFHIRDNRLMIISGDMEFPPDGNSFSQLLKEMNQAEARLMELFIGKRVTVLEEKTVVFTPTQDTEEILFRFSERAGVVSSDDLSGYPVYVRVEGEPLPLNLKPVSRPTSSIRYRIPAVAQITIYDLERNYIDSKFSIAQLGEVMILPKKFLKQKKTSFRFNPENGNLLEIEQKPQGGKRH